MRDVYERNLGNASNVGVSLVHKITLEHLNLNNFESGFGCTGKHGHVYLYQLIYVMVLLYRL